MPKVRNLDLNNYTIPEHLSRHSGYFPARSRGQCGQLLTSSPPSKSSCCRPCRRSWAGARLSWGRSPWRPWAAPATWPGPGCLGTRWWSSSIRRCGPGLWTLAIWVEDLDGGWLSSFPGIPGSPIGFLWSRSGLLINIERTYVLSPMWGISRASQIFCMCLWLRLLSENKGLCNVVGGAVL